MEVDSISTDTLVDSIVSILTTELIATYLIYLINPLAGPVHMWALVSLLPTLESGITNTE